MLPVHLLAPLLGQPKPSAAGDPLPGPALCSFVMLFFPRLFGRYFFWRCYSVCSFQKLWIIIFSSCFLCFSLAPQPPFFPFHGRFVCPQMTLIWPRKTGSQSTESSPGKSGASAALQVAPRKVCFWEPSWAALVGRRAWRGGWALLYLRLEDAALAAVPRGAVGKPHACSFGPPGIFTLV